MSYFESLSLPDKIHYFIAVCPNRALAALLCLCFSLLALVLLVQGFIPLLRRLYVAVFRSCLQRAGIHRAQEYAELLGSWLARLGFSFGFCLIPMCMGFFADAASHNSGPLSMGFIVIFAPISALMMVVAFTIVSQWALVRGRRLRRGAAQ